MAKPKELVEEFKLVFSGRNSLLDSILPPLLFIIINAAFNFSAALWVSLASGLLMGALRLMHGQPILSALAGIGAAALAIGLIYLLKSAQAFFLPQLVNGALMAIVLAASLIVRRPAVAFTSYLARRWPLAWYWHPRIRPAYSEVTAVWAVYSFIKLIIQYRLYTQGSVERLAAFNLISGWPALILLLVFSYLYGLKRLEKLRGPSVEEFKNGTPPPWQGQQRGF